MKSSRGIGGWRELTRAIQRAVRAGADPASDGVRQARQSLVSMLAPFAPHLTEEAWRRMGKGGSVHRAPWPACDAGRAAGGTATVVVQVNGKVRDRFEAPAGMPGEDLEAAARGRARVQAHLKGRSVRRTVVVPNRLVNFVTR